MAKNGIRVRGITIEIKGDTTGLVQSFKNVDAQLKRVQGNLGSLSNYMAKDNSWSTLHNKFNGIVLQQELMNTKQADLIQKIRKEQEALGTLANVDQTPQVIERAQALKTQIILDTAELRNLEQAMKDFGTVGQQKLKAVGDFFQEKGKNVKEFGDNLVSAGRSMSMYVTAPIVGVGTAAMKTAVDFESAMDKVQSVTIGATAEDMERLSQAVLEMSGQSKYSAAEASEALYYMGLAGWDVEEMLDALPNVLAVATAGEMDLGRASDIVTDYFTAFGEGAGTVENMVDVMARTMVSSNTDIDQLGDAFKYVAPVAGAMGYSIEDVSFALGLMANNGIKASQAGTSLRQFMQRLVKPTTEVQTAMDELGITVSNSDGSMKSFRQVMDELRDALGGVFDPTGEAAEQISLLNKQLEDGEISEEEYSEALQDVIDGAEGVTGAEKAKNAAILAGVRGMSGLLAIVNATEEDYSTLSAAIEGTTTAQDIANVMIDNTQGRMEILKHSAENLGISFGQVMTPYIEQGISTLSGLVQKFGELDDGTKDTIVRIAGIAAATGPLLVAAGSVISAIGSITSGVGSLISMIAMHPILAAAGLLAAGIGTLIIQTHEWQSESEAAAAAERERLYGLTEDQKELIEKVNETSTAYSGLAEAKEKDFQDIQAESGYLQSLWEELERNVDANGRVKEGYEERAEVITSILSEALGIEIGLNGDIIEGYKDIQTEIDNLIEKKKLEAMLEAGREQYTYAIKKSQEAYEDYSQSVTNLTSAEQKHKIAQTRLEAATKKYNDEFERTGEVTWDTADAYNKAIAAEQEAARNEDALRQTMEESHDTYMQMQNDIVNYGTALRASTSGNTQAAQDAMNALLYSFKHYGTATKEELQTQHDAFVAMYEQAKKDAAAGVGGVTQATVDGYARMVELSQIELDKQNGVIRDKGKEGAQIAEQNGRNTALAESRGLSSVDMSGPGSEHIKQYVGGLSSQERTAENAAKAAAERSKTGFKSVNMRGPGSEVALEYVEGIKAEAPKASSAATSMAQGALNALKKLDGYDGGANFSKGTAKGIRDYIYTIEEAANEAAAAGKRGFNKPIAIKSPSRVMMESGKYFDQGIAIGIRDNARDVIEEASRLSDETAAAMQYNTAAPGYGMNAGAGSNRTLNMGGVSIVINQQPGENAEQLAEIVMERIERETVQRQMVMA